MGCFGCGLEGVQTFYEVFCVKNLILTIENKTKTEACKNILLVLKLLIDPHFNGKIKFITLVSNSLFLNFSHFFEATYPKTIKGLDTFQGKILHSQHYRYLKSKILLKLQIFLFFHLPYFYYSNLLQIPLIQSFI